VPTNDWWDVSVQSLTRSPDDVKTITSDTPLLEVINLLNETVPALAVVKKEDGALMGLLEKSSIVQRLQQKTEAEPA
jgi:CBS domain-containing protein